MLCIHLSEDWLATGIGLAIVLIIGTGLLGPGPQNTLLRAAPGETVSASVPAVGGWQVSATLAGESITIESVSPLAESTHYGYECQAGQVTLTTSAIAESTPIIALNNQCDGDLSITYKTTAAIPWPVFGFFGR